MRPANTAWGLAAALLAACGGAGLEGSFGDADGEVHYQFSRNGAARITVLGESVPAEYVLDGEKVIVTSPQGTVVLRRRGESLYGPMGLELSRVGPTAGPEGTEP